MRSYRFFLPQNFDQKILEIKEPKFLHQIKNVLRRKIGDQIFLFNHLEKEFQGKIISLSANKVVIQLEKEIQRLTEPKIKIHLYQALLKKDNFEWVVQKTTEAGVAKIIPFLSQNCVKTNLNFLRLEKIAQEAAEQANRLKIPSITHQIYNFKEALNEASQAEFLLILDPGGLSLKNFLDSRQTNRPEKIALFVGPEGGFSSEELLSSQEKGAKIIKLGPRIFRGETAGLVAISFILNYYGE